MYHIKLISTVQDIQNLPKEMITAVGFVLSGKSEQRVYTEYCREIVEKLPPLITKVGFFTNEPKYVLQEIITFCHLETIVTTSNLSYEDVGVPVIRQYSLSEFLQIDLEEIKKYNGIYLFSEDGQTLKEALEKIDKLACIFPIIIDETLLDMIQKPYGIIKRK